MQNNNFWEVFSAVFGALGSLATTAAVIVALWQTKYGQRKKLKLSFSNSTTVFSPAMPDRAQKFITLAIVNVGNRPVIIEKWGMLHHKKEQYWMFISNAPMLGNSLNPSFPYELSCEKKLDLFLERDKFLNMLKEGVKKKELKALRKIKLFVADSTGRIYTVKSKKTIKKMIDEK